MEKRRKLPKILAVLVTVGSVSATLIFTVLMLLGYPGMNIIFCMALSLSVIIAVYQLLGMLRAHKKLSKLASVLQRSLVACLVIGLSGFLMLQGLILSGARTEDAKVDGLIILGAGINGELPSRILMSRLDTALEYLETQGDIPIIVSGGLGPGESITEAEAMFRYLARQGADENKIWKEEKSTSTWENLAFSLALMEENGLDAENATIAIVTNEFHLYRAKHIAGTLGIDAIGVSAQTPYPSLRVLYHFREAAALLNSFVFGGSV